MLTSLNRMVGLPVVWQDRQLGYVERAVPDARARRLSGVVVRKGIGAAKWVSSDGIAVVGSRCVLIRQKPGAVPDSQPGSLGRAFLTTGECVGEVTDMILHGDSLRLEALELSPGPVYRLLGKRAYAAQYRVGGGSRGAKAPDMGAAQADIGRGGRRMSMLKTAAAGAIGFAVGAGAMLMPGNQKLKKQAQKQMDKLVRMAKMW